MDLLIQKFDSTGTLLFSKFFSGNGNINPAASAIDSKDDILIAGEINSGSIDLNPDSNAVNNRARNSVSAKGFILRLSSSGNYLNSVVNEGAGLNFYTDLAVDQNDDYYLAGYYDGTFDLAPGSISQPTTHMGSYQEGAFYQKFSYSDNFLWGTNHPTTLFRNFPSYFQRAKIAVDGQSHFAYLGGFFIDSVFFEPNKVNGLLLANTGRSDQRDSYMMKMDPANDSIYWTYSPYERYSRNDFFLTNISAELDELYFAGSIRGEHRFDGPNSPLKGSDREMQLVFGSLKSCIPNPVAVSMDSSACIPFTDPNGIVYSFPGNYQYTQSYDNRFGCDSLNITVRLNLKGAAMPQISQYWWGLENPTPAAHHTVQWYDCNNGQVLVGDTNALFYPPADGSYALIYGDTSACAADTSQCFTFANVGQNEFNHHRLSIYPNPAQNKLMLATGELEVQNLAIIDSRGTRHKTQKIADGLDISGLSPGVYILELQTDKGALRKRFLKI